MSWSARLNPSLAAQTPNCSSGENRPLRWRDYSWNRPARMRKAQLASDKVRKQMTDGETTSTLQPFNASTSPERHRVLSFSRILAIASNTLTELTRLKVFYVLLVFGLLLIGSSVFMAQFSFQQEFQILKDVSLGAISMFTSLLAIVATARMLPQDIEDRTVYTILAKPVPRFEYLVGKLAGVLLLLAISIVLLAAIFLIVLSPREQSALRETARQFASAPREQLEDALRGVRASALNIDLLPAITLTY